MSELRRSRLKLILMESNALSQRDIFRPSPLVIIMVPKSNCAELRFHTINPTD
jgi:hypothetical protein